MRTEVGGKSGSAGVAALSIFTRVLTAEVLRAHTDGPLSPGALGERLGWAPQASLRAGAVHLRGAGALEPGRAGGGAASELTDAGRDLLGVAAALEAWLSGSPFGPLELSGEAARGTVRTLVAGWASGVVGALAERPRSLAELSREIPTYSYPALKRRVTQLRGAALLSFIEGGSARSPAYEPTAWLRLAAGPLSAAALWERRHAPELDPFAEYDLAAALLLSLPLVELPAGAAGSCVFAAPTRSGANGNRNGAQAPAVVSLAVAEGRIATLDAVAPARPGTWVLGSPAAWLEAVVGGSAEGLRIRGADGDLAAQLIAELHRQISQS